jgi:hypothetical protein
MTVATESSNVSDIQKLNDQVNEITKKEIKNVSESNVLEVDVAAVSQGKRVVYKDRHTWIPALIIFISLSVNVYNVFNGQFLAIAVTSVFEYFIVN